MASQAPAPPEQPSPRLWLGLLAVSLGVALIVVDLTIVNVLLAPVIDDLDIDSTEAQWVQESYAIVFAALLLLAGRLADLYGARRVFLLGLAVFGVTSLGAALAPDGGTLILARFLQGIGGSMVLPTSLALVNAEFTGRARGQAFAVWGSTIGAAAAVGPLLGGWLADISWRWAFGLNIPAVVLIALAARACLAPSPSPSPGACANGPVVDGISATLSTAGLGLLAFGLVEGRTYGWLVTVEPLSAGGFTWSGGPSPVCVALVAAAVALTAFWRRQSALRRRGAEPLMDVGLFKLRSFRNGNVVTLVVGLGEFGIVAVLPLWLQFTLGYSAFASGLALAALAVGAFVASGAGFALAEAVPPLGQVRLGLVLEAGGLVALGLCATADSAWWPVALALFVYGVGVGFATAQVTNVVLADVPPASAGQASGIQSAGRELGSALGIAVLTTLFFSTLGTSLHDRLTDTGMPHTDAAHVRDVVTDSAGAAIPSLHDGPGGARTADAARESMTTGLELASYACAALLLLALAATWSLAPRKATDGEGLAAPDVRPGAPT